MDSQSSFFNSSSGGSRLLSESSFLPSSLSSNTGPGGSDLSISELSLSDKTVRADGEDLEKPSKKGKLQREEKLQNDAFLLKRLNASLKTFNDALGDVGSQNERVAAQLDQTERLLNKYVAILSGSEEYAQLVFDEKWQGGEADDLAVEQEQREAEEKARILKMERENVMRREQERLEREERERADQRQKEQMEKEKKEQASTRGGVRGVRGTRASMRATRGFRGTSGISRPSSAAGSTTTSRGSSTTRGVARRS